MEEIIKTKNIFDKILKKYYALVVILLLWSNAFNQTIGEGYNYYKQGIIYLQTNNFQMADSFITKYLKSRNPFMIFLNTFPGFSAPINDVYFNFCLHYLSFICIIKRLLWYSS